MDIYHTLFSLLELKSISVIAGTIVGYIGVLIMVYGAVKSAWLFTVFTLAGENRLPSIRVDLGKHLALGLEFLVARDVIDSIIRPTWDDLGKLAVIIVLRTIVTLFLAHEIRGARNEQEIELAHKKLMDKASRKKKS